MIFKIPKIVGIGILMVGILISGCSTSKTPEPTITANPGYPAQIGVNDGYPAGNFVPTLKPNETPEIPKQIPVPESGKGSISGVLYSFSINSIIADTQFYLTPAKGAETKEIPLVLIGPDQSAGDIVGWSNSKGQIDINNIPPGKYFLGIWAPMTWVIGETDSTSGNWLIIDIAENQQINLGIIYANWP